MSKLTIDLTALGIIRNLPPDTVRDGAMHEQVNLRTRDGALALIGEKKKEISIPRDVRYIHSISDEIKVYIGQYLGFLSYWIEIGGTVITAEIGISTGLPVSPDMIFSSLSNTLQVIDRLLLKSYVLIFDAGIMQYRVFNKLVPDMPPIEFQSIAKSDDDETKMVRIPIADTFEENSTIILDTLLANALEICARKSEAGYLYGTYLMRCAWELFDGTLVMHSIPVKIDGSYMQAQCLRDLGTASYEVSNRFTGMKVQYKLGIDAADLLELQTTYKGIVKSFNIYATRHTSFSSFTLPESSSPPPIVDDFLFTNMDLYDTSEIIDRIKGETIYYELAKISIESLTADTFADIPDKNVKDIHLQPIMSVGNFSMHKIQAYSVFSYNERIFLGDIENTLYNGVVMRGVVSPPSNPDDYITSTIYQIGIGYEIATQDGTFNVVQWEDCSSYRPGMSDFIIRIKASLGYPDARAKLCKVYVKTPAGHIYLIDTIALNQVESLNFSFGLLTGATSFSDWMTITGEFDDFEWVGTTLSSSNTYRDYNRIQATGQNNPFYFPPEASYRVGNGKIIGMSTNAIALSQGQFGQYPLICFTSEGIWALNFGSGDPLISTISPLSREVCSNDRSICQLDGATAFISARGIHILAGRDVAEISDIIEGTHLQLAYQYMDLAHKHGIAAGLSWQGHAFSIALNTGILGYDHSEDHRELLLSVPAFNYTFAYNLRTKTWHKIAQAWPLFINDFPRLYGYTIEGGVTYRHTINDELFSTNRPFLLETRPLKLSGLVYKKIKRLAVRCKKFTDIDVRIYASNDTSKTYSSINASRIVSNSLVLNRSSYSSRYYIIVIAGVEQYNFQLTHLDIDIEERYAGKLR